MNIFLTIENIVFTAAMAMYLVSTVLYFVYFAMKKERAATIGGYTMLAAFVLHTCMLIARGIGAGRLPMTNQYEFAASFAWGITLCYLIFLRRYRFRAMGTFVSPVVFLIIGYAAMQSREVKELMPALRSSWLAVHVSTAIIAYGAFGVAFAVSALFLMRERLQQNEFWKKDIPDARKLDMISYRAVSFGFLFLTFVLITGAIWAEQAWGAYWSWDPKETWALITWIIYAIYLHLRISRGWSGRSAAIFAVVGFICVIFTYIGVNTLLPGVHSYA